MTGTGWGDGNGRQTFLLFRVGYRESVPVTTFRSGHEMVVVQVLVEYEGKGPTL